MSLYLPPAVGRVRVWQKAHKTIDPTCHMRTLRGGDRNITFWGVFRLAYLCPLSALDTSFTITGYVNILDDHLHLFIEILFLNDDHILQHDNALSQPSVNTKRVIRSALQWVWNTRMTPQIIIHESFSEFVGFTCTPHFNLYFTIVFTARFSTVNYGQ